MATQEKLLKSLDFLRSINSNLASETPTRFAFFNFSSWNLKGFFVGKKIKYTTAM